MSLSKLFQRIIWHNNTTPAINEDNLNAMSKAIDDIDDRVILIGDDVVTVIPQIRAYLEQAEDLAEAMEQLSKNPPYIGSNGNWYVWDTNTEDFVDSGIDASITVSIADINLLPVGSTPYVTNTGTSTDPIFHLYIPQAKSITNVVKDGQYDDPLRDKYNIMFNDGTHTSFLVTNGVGIVSITKTGTQGLVDTYTISFSDRTEYDFTVTNGATGNGIASITKTGTQGLVDTYTITMTDGTTSTFTVTNGESGSADKMDKVNPTGSGAVSIGRRGGSTVGETSVAMGRNVVAGGTGAVAVGVGTEAASFYTFAGGFQSKAQDSGAFAYGIGSISDKRGKAVFGSYNNNRNNTVFEIGNGTSDSARSNIFEIYNDGKISTDNGNTKYNLNNMGDMKEATYDSDSTVKNAGGIADYVEENAVYQYPSNISSGSVLDALSLLYENCPYSHGIAIALLENSVTDRPVGNGWGILILYNIAGTTSCHVRYQDTWSSKTVDGLFNYNASNSTVTWNAYLQDIISNPNLLDNPWFTVNQRGVTSFTDVGGGYSVDRWYHDSNATGSISNGVYTCNVSTYQEWKDDRVTPLLGKVVTLSWLLSDGTIGSETKTLPSTLTSSYVWPFTNSYVVMGLHSNNLSQIARIQPNISIKAVKLELGSVSTLAMDTAPNYATELLKCQMSTASSTDAYANRNISGAELMLEQSQTLSTSADTVYTFTNAAITTSSAIEVYTDIYGINPSNVVVTSGQCVVTFPKQSTAQTMTCRIYIK